MRAVILRGKSQVSNRAATDIYKTLKEHFEEVELWTLNDDFHPFSTRHFDLHEQGNHDISKDKHKRGFVLPTDKRLRKRKNLEAYPLAEIIQYFKIAYFPNTLCYQLALAIYEGFDRVVLVGHDYWVERDEEMLGSAFWIGIGHTEGVVFSYPPTSRLPRVAAEDPPYIYGAGEKLMNLIKEGRVDEF